MSRLLHVATANFLSSYYSASDWSDFSADESCCQNSDFTNEFEDVNLVALKSTVLFPFTNRVQFVYFYTCSTSARDVFVQVLCPKHQMNGDAWLDS